MADEDEVIEEQPPVEKPKASKPVTGRPNDLPIVTHEHPLPNSTLGSRAELNKKRVTTADNKAVEPDDVKTK